MDEQVDAQPQKKTRAKPQYTRVKKSEYLDLQARNSELQQLVAQQQTKLESLSAIEQRYADEEAAKQAKIEMRKQKRREADRLRREKKKAALLNQ